MLVPAAWAQAPKATIDPSELAAGSRPLGLGRAYVGVADDAYSTFQNPAGLALVKKWQLASMYARLIEEVDYHLLGTVHPLSQEAVGVGYLRAAVEGSLFSTRDPVTGRIVPDPDADGAMGYRSEVFYFSYALLPKKYFDHPLLKDISLGANFKVFSQAITGLPAADVAALGHDIDVGIQYRPRTWLTLGLAGYNVLPYNLNGKLIWGSGVSESIPASGKAGLAVKLIGNGGLREFLFRPQELLLGYDYEFTPRGNRPGLSHLGLEWRIFDLLSLRLGLDQDAVATGGGATGIDNNLAAGVGVNLHNFRFDYAFHTFGALSANDTHFFSITYGVDAEFGPAYVEPKPSALITIIEPRDRQIIYSPFVVVKGRVADMNRLKSIRINYEPANLYQDATFVTVAKVPQYGRNTIEVQAVSNTGRIMDKKNFYVTRLMRFTDVGVDHPLRVTAGALGALGYVYGFKDGTFQPEGYLTRAELATLIVRIMTDRRKIDPPASSAFDDISVRHWVAGYVDAGARAGIIKGFPDGKFRPSKGVTRAQAVAFLVRFAGLKEPEFIYEQPFPDVPIYYWAAKEIYLAKQAGLLDYLKGGDFLPNRKITRGEIVDMMSKIKLISSKIDRLLNY